MLKFILTTLSALTFLALGFTVANTFAADKPAAPTAAATADDPNEGIGCPACGHAYDVDDAQVVTLAATTAPATAPATQKAVDVKNTKCIVTEEDVGTESFEYNGKIYHVCCSSCEKDFKKDPDKYLKALAADPAKYGIPK